MASNEMDDAPVSAEHVLSLISTVSSAVSALRDVLETTFYTRIPVRT